MAIRRRRKTLTNLLSTMERRVTAVELRPINLLTTAQVAGAVADEDETLDGGPNAVVSLSAPHQYKAIVDGYYYCSNIAGSPRVELYFEADPGLAKDNTIRISGVNKLNNSGTAVDFDISKDYKTIEVDTPPYDNRATYNGKRHTPGETIASTALFNPKTGNQYSSRRQLIVKRRIDTVEATTTTAKIVFTSTNYFEEGQIVYVGMPSSSVYHGIDGLFRVKEVGSNFITYDFDAALAEPINVASVTDELYVHAVAQSAIRDGATWFDTSQDPDVAYVWDDYRWALFGSSNVSDDNINPNPVEDLVARDDNDTPAGSGEARSRVTLEWQAPTKNEDGTDLVDLLGYTIWSRQYTTQEWDKVDITGPETTWAKSGFLQGKPAYFRVFARDSGGNRSTGVNLTYTTGVFAAEVGKPKAPTVTTYLGTIKIAYDDLTAFGFQQAPSAKEIEVYYSTVSGFTPGPSNYYGKFAANAGSYLIIPGTELVDNTDYYVKIIVRDVYGNITDPSEQVSIRAKLKNIVTFDMIDVGTLTAQAIVGLQIDSNTNPSVNGGVTINAQGITAYNPSGGQTFRLNAITGAVTIGEYLRTDQADGLYLGRNVADGLYATKPSSGQFITDIQAGSIYLSQTSASSNYVTKLDAGTLYVGKGKSAEDINNNSTTINGGKITTGSISANRLGSGELPVGIIYAGDINASQITAGTITGRTVQSGSSGNDRVVLDAPNNRIAFYDGTTLRGRIFADSVGLQIRAGSATYPNIRVGASDITLSAPTSTSFMQLGLAGGVSTFGVTANEVTFNPADFRIRFLGNGTTTKRYVFTNQDGYLFASTSTSGVSDERLKRDIAPISLGLDVIKQLNPVSFYWKSPAPDEEHTYKKQHGLVAQELREVLSSAGITDNSIVIEETGDYSHLLEEGDSTPVLSIDYNQLIPILISSVKELSSKIENLEQQVNTIKDGQ